MKALITGVGGFCAAHLVACLRREDNMEVAGLDRMAAPPVPVRLDRYFQGDISEAGAVDSAVRSFAPDWLFHLAGLSGSTVPAATIYGVNVTGTVHLLEAVRRNVPLCRVLLAGSFAEYGPTDAAALPVTEDTVCRPLGSYGLTKYAATLAGLDYARRLQLKVVIVRPSNIIGAGVPESLVVGAMLARAKQALASVNPRMKVGDFDSVRDFIDVNDAMEAYVRLLKANVSGEIFNVCSGRAHSIRDVAEKLVAHSPRPIELEFDPNLFPASPIRSLYGSYGKAERAIGFRASTPIEDTLKAAWCAEMGQEVACE